jgi:hypothetical protein
MSMLDRLREALGQRQAGTNVDPFDAFRLEHGSSALSPFVVWNLGGAGELQTLPSFALNEWPTGRPLVYIVSDRAPEVLEGLARAVTAHDHEEARSTGGGWGTFGEEWALEGAWSQHRFLNEEESAVLAAIGSYPFHTVIARKDWHATSTLSRLRWAGLVLVVFLHVDNEIAWRRVLTPAKVLVDVLLCTRRGAADRSLMPEAGSLWRALCEVPADERPRAFCCDTEVFTPPRHWVRQGRGDGVYGRPQRSKPSWAPLEPQASRGHLSPPWSREQPVEAPQRARVMVSVGPTTERLLLAEQELSAMSQGQLSLLFAGRSGSIRFALADGTARWGPYQPVQLTLNEIVEWWRRIGDSMGTSLEAVDRATKVLSAALDLIKSDVAEVRAGLGLVARSLKDLGDTFESLLATLSEREPLTRAAPRHEQGASPARIALSEAATALAVALQTARAEIRRQRNVRRENHRAAWAAYAEFGIACRKAGLTRRKHSLQQELPASVAPAEVLHRLLEGTHWRDVSRPTRPLFDEVRRLAPAGMAILCNGSHRTLQEVARSLRRERKRRAPDESSMLSPDDLRSLAALRQRVIECAMAALEELRAPLGSAQLRLERVVREHTPALDEAISGLIAGCEALVPGAAMSGLRDAKAISSEVLAAIQEAEARIDTLAHRCE